LWRPPADRGRSVLRKALNPVPTFRIGARGILGRTRRIEAACEVRAFRHAHRDTRIARRDGDLPETPVRIGAGITGSPTLKSTLNLRRAVARRASSEARTPGYTSSSRMTAAVIVSSRNSTPSSASTEITSTISRWTAAGSLSVFKTSTSTSRVARRRSNAASSIPPFSTSV
jgi:hypothetical protein